MPRPESPLRMMARHPAGLLAAALVALLILGTLAAVLWRAETPGRLGPADWAAVRFTLWQAALSAALSVGVAIPVARALARRRFPGRALLVTLTGAPFILPVIVAIFGLITVFGRSGWLSQLAALAGLPPLSVYGAHGVVLAHVFFNLPLAVRLILQGWLAIPAERFRLADSLGFGPREVFRVLEVPMLRAVVPGALLVIFLICTTSFTVALALGGGPGATTVELAVYQAFRFDFDLGKAALLGLVQVAMTLCAAALAFRVALPETAGGGLDRAVTRRDARGAGLRLWDGAMILAAALFLLGPLAAILARGLPGLGDLPEGLWPAAGRSVAVALASTALTLLLALPMARAAVAPGRMGRLVEGAGYLTIAASPLVIGTGLFILLFPLADPRLLALPVTALVNAAMSLPFALRALVPALGQVEDRFGRLADTLSLTGWARLRWLILPRLRRPMGFAAGLAAALSMGDLGVVTLFADPGHATLPLYMFDLMAGYRMEQAAGAALVLLGLSLAAFWICDRGGRVNADA